MEENEEMEGKDLALDEKEEFQRRILEAIKDLKTGQTTISIEGIEVTNYGKQYTIRLKGITFGMIDSKGNFQYSRENLNKLKEILKEEGQSLEDLGLPDLEEAIDLEEKAKLEKQDEEELNQEDNGEKKEESEKDDEKPKLEDKEVDEKKEEIARKYNVNANNVVHFAKDEKITEHERIHELTNWIGDREDVYIIPGEDEYTYKFVGEKEGELEEIETVANKAIEGKAPDVTIKRVDGEKITEISPLAMYEIDSQTAIAMVKDEHGQTEALYCRQEGGDEKAYWGSVIPEASGKNVLQQGPETREFMDHRYNSGLDLEKRGDSLERQKSLEERGLPSKQEGVQVDEINGSNNQNRAGNIEDIVEDLMRKDGIVDKLTVPPGYYECKAEKVLKLMEEDKEIIYENAVEQVEQEGQREEGGRTPGEAKRDPRRG